MNIQAFIRNQTVLEQSYFFKSLYNVLQERQHILKVNVSFQSFKIYGTLKVDVSFENIKYFNIYSCYLSVRRTIPVIHANEMQMSSNIVQIRPLIYMMSHILIGLLRSHIH